MTDSSKTRKSLVGVEMVLKGAVRGFVSVAGTGEFYCLYLILQKPFPFECCRLGYFHVLLTLLPRSENEKFVALCVSLPYVRCKIERYGNRKQL